MTISLISLLAFFPLTTSTHWWLRLLLWLAFGFGILSGIVTVARERAKEKLLNGNVPSSSEADSTVRRPTTPLGRTRTPWPLAWRRTFLVITGERVTRRASNISLLALGCLLGYAYRDLQQFRHTYILHDLQIMQQQGEDTFQFAFSDNQGTPFVTRFCPLRNGKLPPFRPGLQLRTLVYEDKGDCWNVDDPRGKLGYIFYRPKEQEVMRVAAETQ